MLSLLSEASRYSRQPAIILTIYCPPVDFCHMEALEIIGNDPKVRFLIINLKTDLYHKL